MKTLSENKTFVQYIKQKQDDFKVDFHFYLRKPFNFPPRKIHLYSNKIISIRLLLQINVENKLPIREKRKLKVFIYSKQAKIHALQLSFALHKSVCTMIIIRRDIKDNPATIEVVMKIFPLSKKEENIMLILLLEITLEFQKKL